MCSGRRKTYGKEHNITPQRSEKSSFSSASLKVSGTRPPQRKVEWQESVEGPGPKKAKDPQFERGVTRCSCCKKSAGGRGKGGKESTESGGVQNFKGGVCPDACRKRRDRWGGQKKLLKE